MWLDEVLSCEPLGRDGNNLVYAGGGSAEWERRQSDSVVRYVDESYEEDPHDGHLFGNFIATGVGRDEVILDIGCGLFPNLPHYVSQLGLKRFVGLEPLTAPVERAYPCLVGAMAEAIPLKDNSVDAVLFATSLDHIEAEDAAIEEVKRVLAPNGRIFFWQGLYEPETLPRQKTFERSMAEGPIIGIPLIAAEAVLTAWRMLKRKRQLATGADIDGVHFRYYTRERLKQSLDRWGLRVTRELSPRACPYVLTFVSFTNPRSIVVLRRRLSLLVSHL